jgi:hypothetical protein
MPMSTSSAPPLIEDGARSLQAGHTEEVSLPGGCDRKCDTFFPASASVLPGEAQKKALVEDYGPVFRKIFSVLSFSFRHVDGLRHNATASRFWAEHGDCKNFYQNNL